MYEFLSQKHFLRPSAISFQPIHPKLPALKTENSMEVVWCNNNSFQRWSHVMSLGGVYSYNKASIALNWAETMLLDRIQQYGQGPRSNPTLAWDKLLLIGPTWEK